MLNICNEIFNYLIDAENVSVCVYIIKKKKLILEFSKHMHNNVVAIHNF